MPVGAIVLDPGPGAAVAKNTPVTRRVERPGAEPEHHRDAHPKPDAHADADSHATPTPPPTPPPTPEPTQPQPRHRLRHHRQPSADARSRASEAHASASPKRVVRSVQPSAGSTKARLGTMAADGDMPPVRNRLSVPSQLELNGTNPRKRTPGSTSVTNRGGSASKIGGRGRPAAAKLPARQRQAAPVEPSSSRRSARGIAGSGWHVEQGGR